MSLSVNSKENRCTFTRTASKKTQSLSSDDHKLLNETSKIIIYEKKHRHYQLVLWNFATFYEPQRTTVKCQKTNNKKRINAKMRTFAANRRHVTVIVWKKRKTKDLTAWFWTQDSLMWPTVFVIEHIFTQSTTSYLHNTPSCSYSQRINILFQCK